MAEPDSLWSGAKMENPRVKFLDGQKKAFKICKEPDIIWQMLAANDKRGLWVDNSD